jgi:transcriptional regulator with XRE-family HTH domain
MYALFAEIVQVMYTALVEVNVRKLRTLRRKRVLSLRELGERAGVSKDTLSRIERTGTAYPSTIRKIAKALEIDPSELVPDEE